MCVRNINVFLFLPIYYWIWNCFILDNVVFIVLFFIYLSACEIAVMGRDRMVLGFTTTYAINAYHHPLIL